MCSIFKFNFEVRKWFTDKTLTDSVLLSSACKLQKQRRSNKKLETGTRSSADTANNEWLQVSSFLVWVSIGDALSSCHILLSANSSFNSLLLSRLFYINESSCGAQLQIMHYLCQFSTVDLKQKWNLRRHWFICTPCDCWRPVYGDAFCHVC